MSSNTRRHWMYVAAVAAALALGLPATSAGYQDLRNPDSKYRAIEAERAERDLRNPDTRAAAIDAEREYVREISSQAAEVAAPPRVVESPGFDWGDAAIGAGSVVGLLMIAASAMFAVVHRRSRTATT